MADLPDFLSDEPSSASQAQAEPTPAPAEVASSPEPTPEPAPAAEGPARGPDGKFAPASPPVEAAPAVAAEPPPAEPAPPPPAPPAPDPMAPVAALVEERLKRQAAEREAQDLREWRRQQEARVQQQPLPDPEADPEAYRQHQAAQLANVFWDQRLEMSRQFAEIRHGEESVKTAFDWGVQRCDQDKFFNEQVRASKDPVGFVVAQWQREQQLAAVTSEDFAAYQAWKAAQTAAPAAAVQAPHAAAPAAAPPAQPAAPRPSLAAAPSADISSAPAVIDGAEAYRRMFGT